MNPFEQVSKELYPNAIHSSSKKKGKQNPFEEVANSDEVRGKYDEGFWKSTARLLSQIPQAIAEGTKPGLAAGGLQFLGMGEALDPEEIDRIREISEREGIPFDEEKYMEATENALKYFPTISNIAREVENKTGLPLEPKTGLQKFTRLASTAGKIIPKAGTTHAPHGTTFRGANTNLNRPVLGAGVAGASQVLQQAGVPEPFADLAAFGVLKGVTPGGGNLTIGKKTKPSGLTERQFENLKERKEFPESKIEKINEKVEKDFRDISDRIINESPVGETAQNLKNDPAYKQASAELLEEAQKIADNIPGNFPSNILREELSNTVRKNVKGFELSEYDKSYIKSMQEASQGIIPENITAGELVSQYRKNNASLGEYFEPGSSKAFNRAKRDALLDRNRAIAATMERVYPESELTPVFKEGNARWTKIKDAEEIDGFVNDLFKDKINHGKAKELFEDKNYQRIFKRALGEKGYVEFQQLMKDLISSEQPYKMLKIAKDKGYKNLFSTLIGYNLYKPIGYAKAGLDAIKFAYRQLINAVIDKPKLAINFRKAIKDLKKGDFATAEKEIKAIEPDILPKEPGSKGETFEAKTERIQPERKLLKNPENKESAKSFKTEKGSTYTINEDGTTTRNKAYRHEHGKQEQGLQEKSEKTWFVSKEDADKLGEFQARGAGDKRIIELPDGKLGIMYETGKYAGGVEATTVVSIKEGPEIGLIPVESFEGGRKVHFGNKITELESPKKQIEHKEPAKQELPKTEEKSKKLSKAEKKTEPKKETEKSLTDLKVQEVKRQDISKHGLKKQKEYILEKVQDVLDNPSKFKGERIEFDVPGDGVFRINNNSEAMNRFAKMVKMKWPDKPIRKRELKEPRRMR